MAHGNALALPVAVGGGPFIREEAELHMLFPPPLHGRGGDGNGHLFRSVSAWDLDRKHHYSGRPDKQKTK